MKLTINDKTVSFKFGTKFIRELDKRMPLKQEGVEFGLGLAAKVLPELQAGNVSTLAIILELANKTEAEKAKLDDIDNYIDDVEDIEGLFDEVLKELAESNAGKLAMKNFKTNLKDAKKTKTN